MQRAFWGISKLRKFPTIYSHTISYVPLTFHHGVIIVFSSLTTQQGQHIWLSLLSFGGRLLIIDYKLNEVRDHVGLGSWLTELCTNFKYIVNVQKNFYKWVKYLKNEWKDKRNPTNYEWFCVSVEYVMWKTNQFGFSKMLNLSLLISTFMKYTFF